jgi:hypothetical protein
MDRIEDLKLRQRVFNVLVRKYKDTDLNVREFAFKELKWGLNHEKRVFLGFYRDGALTAVRMSLDDLEPDRKKFFAEKCDDIFSQWVRSYI